MMHNSVYPVCKKFFEQLPEPLYHNLLHTTIWYKHMTAEDYYLVVHRHENCMALSPGFMQDVQPLPIRWHSACSELCSYHWHWCVVTWFEVHKQGSPTVNTANITLPVDTCDKIILSGWSLHCLPAGFLMDLKCQKKASPSYSTASDVLTLWTCPCMSANMGNILWYQRPCIITCTEIPLTEKECSNICPLTQYSHCSVYMISCNISISHSWHAHPFKTYGANVTLLSSIEMQYCREQTCLCISAGWHPSTLKKFNHNTLVLCWQILHLGHHVHVAL
jgi:hypothetical protein